jgi:phosphoribosylanthranilate isomerase
VRVRVKICGIRDRAGMACALEAGADAVGAVLAPSFRRIPLRDAQALFAEVPEAVLKVLVAGRATRLELARALACAGADLVQAEGASLPGQRVLPVERDGPDLPARLRARARQHSMVLVEGAVSGRGVRAEWARVADAADAVRTATVGFRLVLSGGLSPESVAGAIREVRPYAVDVSSGVERAPGVKDAARVRAFVLAARDTEVTP